ncbi:MAG: tRNA-(ms[2]io[6]A)-hydroxylase [Microscillaceae bacterium]|nr:tRNA-(ms[2]io[6]A)-hydroxylase [Microscillaceae bacterium]
MAALGLDILRAPSPIEWIETVLNDFPAFMQDHADCERKASAMALSFIAKYPDRLEIIPELMDTAVEELQHFRQVYRLMEKRGIPLAKEITKDTYVGDLLGLCRSKPQERFLDRLVIASVVEWRGCERFKKVAEALQEPELQNFYALLWQSEARHGESFTEMAKFYFPREEINCRLDFFLTEEALLIKRLPLRPALH